MKMNTANLKHFELYDVINAQNKVIAELKDVLDSLSYCTDTYLERNKLSPDQYLAEILIEATKLIQTIN
jgi:hypothetical protein